MAAARDLQFASKAQTGRPCIVASRLQTCACIRRLLWSNHPDARQQKRARMSCSARRTSWRIRGELDSVRRSSRWSSCPADGLVLFGLIFHESKLSGLPSSRRLGHRPDLPIRPDLYRTFIPHLLHSTDVQDTLNAARTGETFPPFTQPLSPPLRSPLSVCFPPQALPLRASVHSGPILPPLLPKIP